MTARNVDANDVAREFGFESVRKAFEQRVMFYQGQTYHRVGEREHVRRDGTLTRLSEWQSHCPTCGAKFTFWHPALARKFQPNRRCSKHKRPGQRVRSDKC